MRYLSIALLLQFSLLFAQNRTVAPVGQDAPAISSGKYYALLIAVEDYDYIKDLDFPVSDAKALRKVLTKDYNFSPENVTLLKNPDRGGILENFAILKGKLTSNDNLLIFYAGHGLWDEDIEQGYWQPANAGQAAVTEWISNGEIRDQILGIKCKHILLISDACFSGGILKTRTSPAANKAISQLYSLTSRIAMTSGTLNEVPDKSVFAKYLLKSLKNNRAPYLQSKKLFGQFETAVIANSPTAQVPQYGYIHGAGHEGGDFIFVRAGSAVITNASGADDESQVKTRSTSLPGISRFKRFTAFRFIPRKNLENASEMLKRLDFYDKNENPAGKGFANNYETKTLSGKKVVIDRASGSEVNLLWQQSGSDSAVWYKDAAVYIERLNREKYAGLSAWRLPTLEEAMSLMEPQRKRNNLYIDPVFSVKQWRIWTADENSAAAPWGVNFADGACHVIHSVLIRNYIRAVCIIKGPANLKK